MDRVVSFCERIPEFENKLNQIQIDAISPELYCRKYLIHLLQHRTYFLTIYAIVLDKLLLHSKKHMSEISLVDIGAGNGLLGLFAKYVGFKSVYINDSNQRFVAASQQLALQLKIEPDGFIYGGIEEVQLYFKTETPDAVVGTDVIEHIYNLNIFFETIQLMNPEMVSVFTTASNPENYFKVQHLRKLQRKDELEGGNPEDNELFGEKPLASFLNMRKGIIVAHFSDITAGDLEILAQRTRGMIEVDILKVIDQFRLYGTLPPMLVNDTNTCEPYSGSWTERILQISEYQSIYQSCGFQVNIYNGFYDEDKKGLKKLLNKIFNGAVRIFGIQIAPFIIFAGSKK